MQHTSIYKQLHRHVLHKIHGFYVLTWQANCHVMTSRQTCILYTWSYLCTLSNMRLKRCCHYIICTAVLAYPPHLCSLWSPHHGNRKLFLLIWGSVETFRVLITLRWLRSIWKFHLSRVKMLNAQERKFVNEMRTLATIWSSPQIRLDVDNPNSPGKTYKA